MQSIHDCTPVQSLFSFSFDFVFNTFLFYFYFGHAYIPKPHNLQFIFTHNMMHIKNYFYLILIEEDTQAKMAKNQTTFFQPVFYFLFFVPTILVKTQK